MDTETPNHTHPLPSDDDVLIPAQAIGLYTGMAPQTHTRWRHEGTGPPFLKLGHKVFYRSGDVRTWLRDQTRVNTITQQ